MRYGQRVLTSGQVDGLEPVSWADTLSRVTLDDLRRYAVARTLFPPATLQQALDRLGFVQADPIRAPARAQDLTLRHRVTATAPAISSASTPRSTCTRTSS